MLALVLGESDGAVLVGEHDPLIRNALVQLGLLHKGRVARRGSGVPRLVLCRALPHRDLAELVKGHVTVRLRSPSKAAVEPNFVGPVLLDLVALEGYAIAVLDVVVPPLELLVREQGVAQFHVAPVGDILKVKLELLHLVHLAGGGVAWVHGVHADHVA